MVDEAVDKPSGSLRKTSHDLLYYYHTVGDPPLAEWLSGTVTRLFSGLVRNHPDTYPPRGYRIASELPLP